jgi:hypothetical protein
MSVTVRSGSRSAVALALVVVVARGRHLPFEPPILVPGVNTTAEEDTGWI